MKLKLILFLAFIVWINAEDTYYCPDGWDLQYVTMGNKECKCFLFADTDVRMTHDDATAVCESHNGWLAELETGDEDNTWIVKQLLERYRMSSTEESTSDETGPHFDDQWWIGAKSYTKHNKHMPGEWIWEHLNETVTWFDWAPDQPDDWHRQRCMTYLRYSYGDDYVFYNWNDWDCNTVADYICQKDCASEDYDDSDSEGSGTNSTTTTR